jgi:hypothetical protein
VTDDSERLRVLLLADNHRSHASTLLEHINALRTYSRHDVRVFNPRKQRGSLSLTLNEFDVVVIHYSVMILLDHYLPPFLREEIAGYSGLKIQFIQDDYRRVHDMWHRMRELGVDVLFTLVPERELDAVWQQSVLAGVRRLTTLAGFVPINATRFPRMPLDARPVDVGYRGRVLPPWLGVLGQEKAWIAQGFQARAGAVRLRHDIAWTEDARIYGEDWFDFIASCRVTLGTESGSTITDFDGTLERRTMAFMETNPDADFWQIHSALLAPFEGNVKMNVISPRIFEAIALKTGLVLFPGEYSGVLQPEKHYIPLNKNFSNFDEVVEKIRDTPSLQDRIENAYSDVVESGLYSYQRLAEAFDQAILEAGARKRAPRVAFRYRAALAEQRMRSLSINRPGSLPRKTAHILATARLVASDARVLTVLWQYVLHRRVRRSVDLRALLIDLTRIAILRRSHAGRLTAGAAFTTTAADDPATGGVQLVSIITPAEAHPPRNVRFPLTWNHAALGDSFVVPLSRWHWSQVSVGAHGGCVHEFTALHAIAESASAGIRELVSPLFAPSLSSQNTAVLPARLPLPLHLLRYSRHYVRKALHVLAVLLTRREIRSLVLCARQDISGTAALIADVMKLEAVRSARQGRLQDVRDTGVQLANGVLTITSRSQVDQSSLSAVTPSQVSTIRWDHSDVGVVATVRTVFGNIPYGLLPHGKHEFAALDEALRRAPDVGYRVLTTFISDLRLSDVRSPSDELRDMATSYDYQHRDVR